MPPPYQSMCTGSWDNQGFNSSWYVDELPDYSVAVRESRNYYFKAYLMKSNFQTCQRHCIQLDIIKSCGCFHINMDLDLINITRAEFANGTRTCSVIPKADSNLEKILWASAFYAVFQTRISNASSPSWQHMQLTRNNVSAIMPAGKLCSLCLCLESSI